MGINYNGWIESTEGSVGFDVGSSHESRSVISEIFSGTRTFPDSVQRFSESDQRESELHVSIHA